MNTKEKEYEKIWDKANQAGLAAALAHRSVPDGVYGFAWIDVFHAASFGRWLVRKTLGNKRIGQPGYRIWVSAFNQSMEKKKAYAHAFATVLRKYKITAYANSRMD